MLLVLVVALVLFAGGAGDGAGTVAGAGNSTNNFAIFKMEGIPCLMSRDGSFIMSALEQCINR